MPTVVNKETGERLELSNQDASRAVDSGIYAYAGGQRINVSDATGSYSVAASDAGQAVSDVESQESQAGRIEDARRERLYGGALDTAITGAENIASGATLGLYDVGARALGGADYAERRQIREEVNPYAAVGGQVIGGAAPALLGGLGTAGRVLAKTPAGLAARAGESIARGGASVAGRVGRAALGGAVEGAAVGVGEGLKNFVISDEPLTAARFAAEVGSGALMGAGIGGGVGGLGSLAFEGVSVAAAKGRQLIDELDEITKRAKESVDGIAGKSGKAADDVDDIFSLSGKDYRGRTRSGDLSNKQTRKGEEVARRQLDATMERTRKSLRDMEVEDIRQAGDYGFIRHVDVESSNVRSLGYDPENQIMEVTFRGKRKRKDGVELDKLTAGGEKTERSFYRFTNVRPEEYTAFQNVLRKGRTMDKAGAGALVWDELNDKFYTKLMAENPLGKGGEMQVAVGRLFPDADLSEAGISSLRDQIRTELRTSQMTARSLEREAEELLSTGGLAPDVAQQLDRVKKARDLFNETFSTVTDEGTIEVSNQVLDGMFAGDPRTFGTTMRVKHYYEEQSKLLAELLDGTGLPSPSGAPRAAAFESLPSRVAAAEKEAAGGKSFDILDMLGIMDIAGVDLEDVPIIGKIPGAELFIKARTIMRGAKGIGAKVGALGGIGPVAERAAVFKERINSAAMKLAQPAKDIAKRVSRAKVPAAVKVLSSVTYDPDGSGARPKDPVEAFRAREQEINKALSDPQGFRDKLAARLTAPESLANAIAEAQLAKIRYLSSILPSDKRPPSPFNSEWRPSTDELNRFSRAAYALERPASVLDQIAAGTLSREAADAVREGAPEIYGDIVDSTARVIEQKGRDIPYQTRLQLGILQGQTVEPTSDPDFSKWLSELRAPKQDDGSQSVSRNSLRGISKVQMPKTQSERLLGRG